MNIVTKLTDTLVKVQGKVDSANAAQFEEELLSVFRSLFPDFDNMKKSLIITHPDLDHCGLMRIFDHVYVSSNAYRNFELEYNDKPNFREKNPLHAPYYRISRILTQYEKIPLDRLTVIGEDRVGDPLTHIGEFNFHDLHFYLYAGNGGHNLGEIVLCNEENKLVFTGDIMVNIRGFRKEQAAFNALAPYLMTSVNMDSTLASEEREAVMVRFSDKEYTFCCGHGAIMTPKK